ncbi:hypothetical protein H4W80_008182 [Nonomuraea angiospora]|uniref:Uncharacterized protein n=1 Tax=Nonomuraea angiospora TaxID=46172 RepID=A0ABR9MAJ1_9ACTN|nr:hypothetical protein [Nonomuraea angiospora]
MCSWWGSARASVCQATPISPSQTDVSASASQLPRRPRDRLHQHQHRPDRRLPGAERPGGHRLGPHGPDPAHQPLLDLPLPGRPRHGAAQAGPPRRPAGPQPPAPGVRHCQGRHPEAPYDHHRPRTDTTHPWLLRGDATRPSRARRDVGGRTSRGGGTAAAQWAARRAEGRQGGTASGAGGGAQRPPGTRHQAPGTRHQAGYSAASAARVGTTAKQRWRGQARHAADVAYAPYAVGARHAAGACHGPTCGECTPYDRLRPTCGQRATCARPARMHGVRRAACGVRRAACGVRPAACGVRLRCGLRLACGGRTYMRPARRDADVQRISA